MKNCIFNGSMILFLFFFCSQCRTTDSNSNEPTILYVSPTGSGDVFTFDAPGSLQGARDKVRTINGNMTSDITVYLRGGTYALTSPLQLTENADVHDSGSNGYSIIYCASLGETPVLSGGQVIQGWALHEADRHIYHTYVGTSFDTRQLFVNGVRAQRARGQKYPGGFSKTDNGYATPDATLASWRNITAVEIVAYREWRAYRCPIAYATAGAIVMQQPCWANSNSLRDYAIDTITWIENAYELLDEPGEWYLDRSIGYLYYIPRSGEDMTTATVIAPVLQTLCSATGLADHPIHNLRFEGITFSHTTWLGPNSNDGYASLQAGVHIDGAGASAHTVKTPAAVDFKYAKAVTIAANTFSHLGGAGLNFESACQNNVIENNRFSDISSCGIQIGNHDIYSAPDLLQNKLNIVRSNDINQVAVEYEDAVGIWVGYTNGTIVDHNDVSNLSYTGISLGWGWGQAFTYAQNNQVTNNHIHHVMQVLNDGGAIYTLDSQPNSIIDGNYIHDLPDLGQAGNRFGIYLDNGSQLIVASHNVLANLPCWLKLQTVLPIAENNIVQHNFTNSLLPNANDNDLNNTLGDNLLCTAWPAAAQLIIKHAGIVRPDPRH